MRVPGNRHKYHCPRNKKIFDGYDDFNTYFVRGLSRDTNNFGRSDIRHHVMTLEASIVVIRLSKNNKNTTVLSTLFVPYLRGWYEQVLSQIEQLQ